MPDLAAPLGTYLGWNLRKAGFGEGDLCLVSGSYIPFPAAREVGAGDSRAPVRERYPSPAIRVASFRQATDQLRRDGFLLEEDAARLRNDALTEK